MTNQFRFKASLVVAIILVLVQVTSCTTVATVPKTEYNKAENQHIKKIALLRIGESPNFTVRNFTSEGVANAFSPSLLGASLTKSAASAQHEATSRFFEALQARQIRFAPPLIATIQEELQKAGYDVVYQQDQKPWLLQWPMSYDYRLVEPAPEADAILHVWLGTTGYAAGSFSAYQPWMYIYARLLDARSRKELYVQAFLYGGKQPGNENLQFVAADEKYRFNNVDALVSGADSAAAGLLLGEKLIASAIAQHLKRN